MSQRLLVKGGRSLHGEIVIGGDTHAAIACICYALLCGGRKRIHRAPRTAVLINFVNAFRECGFDLKWIDIDKIEVNNEWANQKGDFSKVTNQVNSVFLEIAANLVLAKRYSVRLPIRFRKNLDRYKRLGFVIDYKEDSYFEVVRPSNIILQNIHINSFERNFYTLLNYRILKYIFPQIFIDFQNNYHPLNIFEIKEDFSILEVHFNKKEFNLYVSLAMLNDGEIDILGFDLSKSLSFLMDVVEIGAEYEVTKNRLRVWQSKKSLKQNYDYIRSELDELGYCLAYLSLNTTENIRIVCRDTKPIRNLLTILNMVGCEIVYSVSDKKYNESLHLVVKPSNLRSFKISDENIDVTNVIILLASSYKGNSFVDIEDSFKEYFPDAINNLQKIGLKLISKE